MLKLENINYVRKFPLPLNEIPKNFHFSLNSNKLFIGKFTLDIPGW